MTRIFTWPVDTPIHQAIGEAIGAASVCWEHRTHLEAAGVFDGERANQIVEDLLDLLQRKQWAE